jgi:DNA-binding NtrC family response regulator
MSRTLSGISTAAERMLQLAPWDGNVRELRNVIERACLMSEARMLGERDIQAAMKSSQRPVADAPASMELGAAIEAGGDLLSTVQRSQIDRVLKRVGGNKTQAARLLGISRRSLYRWIDRLDRTEADSGTAEE